MLALAASSAAAIAFLASCLLLSSSPGAAQAATMTTTTSASSHSAIVLPAYVDLFLALAAGVGGAYGVSYAYYAKLEKDAEIAANEKKAKAATAKKKMLA